MATWEKVLVGIGALLVFLWFRPGIKQMLEHSRTAPKDWRGALLPIGAVILFVIILIASVR